MSVYPPPTEDASIFNPSYFVSPAEGVTAAYVDLNYLKKAGGQTVVAAETFTGGILTNSITPSSGNDITMASVGTAEATTVTVDNLNASMIVQCNNLQAVTQIVTNEVFCTTATASQGLTAGNVTVSGAIAGTLSTAAQPNVTSVGTLTSLDVSGAIAGTLSTAAQPNVTSLGTLTSVNTSGAYQISGANFVKQVNTSIAIGNNTGMSGTPAQSIFIGNNAGATVTHSGVIVLNASASTLNSDGSNRCFVKPVRNTVSETTFLAYNATTSEVTYTNTFSSLTATNLAGTLTTAAQPNVTSVGTVTSLSVRGAIAGTLSTAAQPNVTSVGTLTSLSVSGTLTQTGAATFSTNITQSAGTSALKATTADSLTVSGTSTLATVTLNSPYFINMGGSLKMYGAVPITAYTLSQTSTGSSPVIYTNTYTFSVTSTNMPLLSGTYIFGKLVVMVTTTGQQGYGEYIINKTTTTPTVTVFDAVQNTSWSSLTVTGASATTLSVVVTQTNASTVPTVVTPTLQLMFTAYDY